MTAISLGFQVFLKERGRIVPQLVRRAFAVGWPIVGEKGVAGVLVDFGGDVLAGAPRFHFASDGTTGRVLILDSEHPKERAVQLVIRSSTGVGRDGVVSASGVARWMKPPQQSTAALTLLLEHAKSSVCRPPEQKPIAPTLPVAPGRPLRKSAGGAGDRPPPGVAEGRTSPGLTVAKSPGSFGLPSRAVEVGGQRVVADIGEAAGQVADMVGEAERLHDHDDAGVIAGLVLAAPDSRGSWCRRF